MSDLVEIALIGFAGSFLSSVLAIINNRMLARNHQETKTSIETLHKEVNGKMAALLQVTGQAEHAKGKLEGQAEPKE